MFTFESDASREGEQTEREGAYFRPSRFSRVRQVHSQDSVFCRALTPLFPISNSCGTMRLRLGPEANMRADQVEVSWNEAKSSWLVRIVAGEEAIRRHSDLPKSADDASLRSAAESIVKDEGYELDTAAITVRR
jgi:hypothetical protein